MTLMSKQASKSLMEGIMCRDYFQVKIFTCDVNKVLRLTPPRAIWVCDSVTEEGTCQCHEVSSCQHPSHHDVTGYTVVWSPPTPSPHITGYTQIARDDRGRYLELQIFVQRIPSQMGCRCSNNAPVCTNVLLWLVLRDLPPRPHYYCKIDERLLRFATHVSVHTSVWTIFHVNTPIVSTLPDLC